jgi:surfeit locus 1 family protein
VYRTSPEATGPQARAILPNPQIQRRGFSPTWPLTLGAIVLCALFIRLGFWQWDRGNLRQAQWEAFARGADQAVPLDSRGMGEVARFQRVIVLGQYDPAHQFLLDNRTHNGEPGYEVLTPLDRPDGRIVLVDRGWVAFTGSRQKLPDVTLQSPGSVTLTGRSDELPSAGLPSGRAAPSTDGTWPKVTTYPTMAELSTAFGHPLEPRILLLDPREPQGYVRDWHPPGMQPVRHWSYAIQWWAFAVVVIIFWAVVSRNKGNPLESAKEP